MIDFQNDFFDGLTVEDFVSVYELLANSKDIELIIVNNDQMRQLNLEHRGVDKTTDVLSFPAEFEFAEFLGSVVISYEMAQSVANELRHSVKDEAKVLFIHGILHLLGYDHEIDNGEMREKERDTIKTLNLPDSLIERNCD